MFKMCLAQLKQIQTNDMKTQYAIRGMNAHDLITNIKQHFNNCDNVLYKGRNEIKLLEFDNQKYVVKRFKSPNFINKIIYTFFRDSKAKRSFEYSEKIISLTKYTIKNNATPNPIGYIDFFGSLFINDSYYVCEYVDNCFEIRELIDKAPYPNWQDITKEFTTFTYSLHKMGIFHQDYSSGNILIKKQNGGYCFFIVDVNRMIFKPFNILDGLKNFNKLWANEQMIQIISAQYSNLLLKDKLASTDINQKYCLEQISKYDKELKQRVLLKRKIKNSIKDFFLQLKDKLTK